MRNRPLSSCFILIATQVAICRAVTNNDDGTGGTPPAIYQYVMLNGDISNEWIGFDPHSAHGVVTQDNGYILTGSAMVKEVANAKCLAFNYLINDVIIILCKLYFKIDFFLV